MRTATTSPLPAPAALQLPSPRWRAVAALAAAVLLVHGLLLGLFPRSAGPGWRGEPVRMLQVRRLAADAVADAAGGGSGVAAVAAAARAPAAAGRAVAPVTRPAEHLVETRAMASPSSSEAVPATEGAEVVNAARAADTGATAAAGAAALPAVAEPQPSGVAVPVYATQLPPPVTLLYDMRRNGQRGSAELHWSPSGSSYSLQLQGQPAADGRGPGLAWASAGALDADGIAPDRHTESRRGRALRAVNFQRDSGRITFSGPQTEAALLPGTQDRLSWMLQLAGVLAANPQLATAGAQVLLFVAGTRGDAEVWTFDVLGSDAVELADGSTAAALHLQRLPRRPYDTTVDIWLDPARHHLPVRTRLLLRPGSADVGGTEFVLRSLQVR